MNKMTSPASGALPADPEHTARTSASYQYAEKVDPPYDAFNAARVAFLKGADWQKSWDAALASREASPGVMVDMVPPATARDRWMYEQGRLAERDPRTPKAAALASPQVAPALSVDCHACLGSGDSNYLTPEWPEKAVRCDKCSGTGRAAPAPVAPTPAATVTMPCEDCGGCGEVGEAAYQGAFQPPERDRCESCQGSGQWEAPLTPSPIKKISAEMADYIDKNSHSDSELAWVSRMRAAGLVESPAPQLVAPTPAQPSQWQPIETAPKDGTHIVVYAFASNDEGDKFHMFCAAFWSGDDGGFVPLYEDDWSLMGDDLVLAPTHWATLPSEPEGESA